MNTTSDLNLKLKALFAKAAYTEIIGLVEKIEFSNEPLNYESLNYLGLALLYENVFAAAEVFFLEAQDLAPEEPAAFCNLAQLYFSDHKDDSAREIALLALDRDPNSKSTWTLLYKIYSAQNQDNCLAQIERTALKKGSWLGLDLLSDLRWPKDLKQKLVLLDPLFQRGERDPAYLMQLTGLYGATSDYDKVLYVHMCVESELGPSKVPWHLDLHAMQACLASEKYEKASVFYKNLEKRTDIAPEISKEIQEMGREIAENRLK